MTKQEFVDAVADKSGLSKRDAGAAVDLARKEYRLDFTDQGGYMNRGGLDPMWQAGVSLNLPLRRGRRAAAVAEAESALAAARARGRGRSGVEQRF